MDSHSDEINEMKLLNRRNKTMKHVIAKQKIDQTGNTDDGYSLLRQLENAEDKSLSGSGIDRKIGAGRKKKVVGTITETPTKSTRTKTEWQILVNKTMNEQGLGLKDTLKYIKENNLYKKKGSRAVKGLGCNQSCERYDSVRVQPFTAEKVQQNRDDVNEANKRIQARQEREQIKQREKQKKLKKHMEIDSDDILPGFIDGSGKYK